MKSSNRTTKRAKKNPRKKILRKKRFNARASSIGYGPMNINNLNAKLSSLNEEERKSFSGSYQAFRAKSARDDDTSIV